MKKTIALCLLLAAPVMAQEKYLTEIYAKSDSELVAITDEVTDAEFSYMSTIIGRKFRGLGEAMLERGYSPNDFAGSITTAYTAAVDSGGFLIIPASYSTDSSVTYTTAPIIDFRNNQVIVTPLAIKMSATPAPTAAQVFLDTTVTDHDNLLVFGDKSGDDHFLLSFPIANLTATDGHVVSYNAGNNEFEMVTASSSISELELYDADSDTIRIDPSILNVFQYKDASTSYFLLDSLGLIDIGGTASQKITINSSKADYDFFVMYDTDTIIWADAGTEIVTIEGDLYVEDTVVDLKLIATTTPSITVESTVNGTLGKITFEGEAAAWTIGKTGSWALGTPVSIDSSLISDNYNFAADAQASDAYVMDLPGVSSLVLAVGQMFTFTANTANTDAATLNVESTGAKTIKKLHDQDLETGDIEAGQVVIVVYDGANMQMTSQLAQ